MVDVAAVESLWCTACDSLFCSCLDSLLESSMSTPSAESVPVSEEHWVISDREMAEGMAETRNWAAIYDDSHGSKEETTTSSDDQEHSKEEMEEGEDEEEENGVIQEVYVDEKPVKKSKVQDEAGDGPRKLYERFREKQFVCDLCEQSFTLKQNVQQHIFNFHGLRSTSPDRNHIDRRFKRFMCTKCDKVFKTMEMARAHFRKVHGKPLKQEKKIHKCDHCDKVYPAKTQLNEHISIVHRNERNFVCDQCGSAFGRRGGLRRHVQMVHVGQLYSCPYEACDHPGYKCPKALAAHVRAVHTGDRPFKCTHCDRSFVRRNDLKVHEVTHSASVEQKCDLCGSVFKREHYLKKHRRTCDGKTRHIAHALKTPIKKEKISLGIVKREKVSLKPKRAAAIAAEQIVKQMAVPLGGRRMQPNRRVKNRI
ncbi:hypothetical protein QR680_009788 [Steinernema hermaphroditum]|uniref:C2H2-type domain-containing protein n=1 Tax=Steinernema hermaphroditum TaxID=289476 RepID=A0AA39ILN2_9BILA|nr:hypothetical protein QR680_009788 [Steinernema hermaphroditum]